MDVNRRDVIKALFGGSAVAAIATSGMPSAARASETDTIPPLPDAVGLMYDATKCIGCRACMPACQNENGLTPDTGATGGLYHPRKLNHV